MYFCQQQFLVFSLYSNLHFNYNNMGQQIPPTNNPPVRVQRRDQFESKYIQRVKETPFIEAAIYTSQPLLFTDPLGPTLHSLIKPRIGTNQLFPQDQISKLIVSVLTGLKDLQENGIKGHGDLSLDTIYYSKKQKYFKLIHPVFNQESGYLLTKHGKRFTTLSPQQLSALSQNSENSQISLKSDIFAFGIALCEVCTLTPSSDIYCPQSYSIFHLQIQKRLQIVEEYYPPWIVDIITSMLQYDPDSRPSPIELLQIISQMQNQEPSVIVEQRQHRNTNV